MLSNISSARACEALLSLLNQIVERDELELSWTVAAFPKQELVLQVNCFAGPDRAKFIQHAPVRKLLADHRIVGL